jgi:hypothetical protein
MLQNNIPVNAKGVFRREFDIGAINPCNGYKIHESFLTCSMAMVMLDRNEVASNMNKLAYGDRLPQHEVL